VTDGEWDAANSLGPGEGPGARVPAGQGVRV